MNGPVVLLLCGPLFTFGYAIDHGIIPRSLNWVGLIVFLSGLILAWLWWSLAVPRWRLWAYERVENIPHLKERAIAVGLIWPDGHFFARTEVKSKAHALREKQLDSANDERGG